MGASAAPRSPRASTHDRGVFMISVAAELAEMHPQTLRMYEARGLIEPKRSPKGTRLYSHADVERLRRIQEMTTDGGMNLAGVERVFELEEQLERMQRKVGALERRAERARGGDRAARGGQARGQGGDRPLRGALDRAGARAAASAAALRRRAEARSGGFRPLGQPAPRRRGVRADVGRRPAPASVPAVGSGSGPGEIPHPPRPGARTARRGRFRRDRRRIARPRSPSRRGNREPRRRSRRLREVAGACRRRSPAGVPCRGERALMPPVGRPLGGGPRSDMRLPQSGGPHPSALGMNAVTPGCADSRRGRRSRHATRGDDDALAGDDRLPSAPARARQLVAGRYRPSACSAAAAPRRSGSPTT